MNNATLERKASDFEEPVKVTQSLSPLLILEVGQMADGVLEQVNASPKRTKKGVIIADEFRYFYVLRLLASAEGKTAKKGEGEAEYISAKFKAGDVIALPGAGGLDYTLAALARKVSGQKKEEAPNWEALSGHRLIISRTEDEVMKSGEFEGNPVKCYDVQHSRPKGK